MNRECEVLAWVGSVCGVPSPAELSDTSCGWFPRRFRT